VFVSEFFFQNSLILLASKITIIGLARKILPETNTLAYFAHRRYIYHIGSMLENDFFFVADDKLAL
jgi:hypothetical protein